MAVQCPLVLKLFMHVIFKCLFHRYLFTVFVQPQFVMCYYLKIIILFIWCIIYFLLYAVVLKYTFFPRVGGGQDKFSSRQIMYILVLYTVLYFKDQTRPIKKIEPLPDWTDWIGSYMFKDRLGPEWTEIIFLNWVRTGPKWFSTESRSDWSFKNCTDLKNLIWY